MKAVVKDNTRILLSKLNSQELAVLENFITKSANYITELTELDNIDGEVDGLNFKITDDLKVQIAYESPYNIVLLPATKAKIDLKVASDVTVEVINEYTDYLNTNIENNIIEVSLTDAEEYKNDCVNFNLGIKLSKEGLNDVNLSIIVTGIYSLSGASKLSDLENDMGFIDNTVDDLVNYYTKTETDNLLDTKQDTLTAGTNITIENGTISATDTVYDDTLIRAEIAALDNAKADKSEIPTDVSELNNDANYATTSYVDEKSVTFKPFLDTFVTDGTTQQFLNSITGSRGTAYLGTVELSDMPDGIWAQAEVEVYCYNYGVIYCIMRSADVSPYEWECNSYSFRGWEPVDKTAKDYADDNFLKKTNTTSYTPTGNYNPATKKYVDDQVGAINIILATLTTPSNNGGE